MTTAADVVVVGGGVIGCSTALELTRNGHSVVVVDKLGGPGQGSTSSSSAVVRFNYSTFPGVAASWEAKHCWESWTDHLGNNDDGAVARFHRTGMVFLDVDVAPKERFLPLFDQAAIPYEVWDPDTLEQRVPGIDAGRYWPPKRIEADDFWTDAPRRLGGVWSPDAGFVDDPQLAAINLADAARRRGATFRFNRQVETIRQRGNRVTGVTLDDGDHIDAGIVVNVAGPWSGALNRLADVGGDFTVQVRPMRQEVHHVTAPPGFNQGRHLGPVIADVDLGTYLRAAPGDGLLVGGTEPECDPYQWLDNPDEANSNVTSAVFDAQVTRAARRFPDLRVPPKPRGVAGVYDVATDWTPIYDRTSLDGFYVAMGTSGNQFKNAPVAGRFMAAIIDAVENGHDHDSDPVAYTGEHTGLVVNLGAFSRKRTINTDSSRTVMG